MALRIMALDCEDAAALDEMPHSSLAWPLQTDTVGKPQAASRKPQAAGSGLHIAGEIGSALSERMGAIQE